MKNRPRFFSGSRVSCCAYCFTSSTRSDSTSGTVCGSSLLASATFLLKGGTAHCPAPAGPAQTTRCAPHPSASRATSTSAVSARVSIRSADRTSGLGAPSSRCWSSGPIGATKDACRAPTTGSSLSSMVAGSRRPRRPRPPGPGTAGAGSSISSWSGAEIACRRRVGPVGHLGQRIRVVGKPARRPGCVARRLRPEPTVRRRTAGSRRSAQRSRCCCARRHHPLRNRARSAPHRTRRRRRDSLRPAAGSAARTRGEEAPQSGTAPTRAETSGGGRRRRSPERSGGPRVEDADPPHQCRADRPQRGPSATGSGRSGWSNRIRASCSCAAKSSPLTACPGSTLIEVGELERTSLPRVDLPREGRHDRGDCRSCPGRCLPVRCHGTGC